MKNEELVARIQAGESDLIETLWLQVEQFIRMMANKWKGQVEMDDLIQQGFLILYTATAEYTPEHGVSFINYLGQRLPWGWLRWIGETEAAVRLPSYMIQRIRQYERIQKEYVAEHGCVPPDGHICHIMGIGQKQLRQIQEANIKARMRSLNETVEGLDGDTIELQDMLADESDFTADILEDRQREQLAAVIWPMVEELEEQQAAVIWKRYRQNMTPKECSQSLGVSIERTQQYERKAMRTLRLPKYTKELQPFLPEMERYNRGIKCVGFRRFDQTWTSATERTALYAVRDR